MLLRDTPALPDPRLQPPTLAEAGDPFAALRVVHLLARVPRGESVRVRDVVDRLNKEPDPQKRLALWAEGQDILDNDPPEISFGFTAHQPMWQDFVKGLNWAERLHQEWGRYSTTVWLDK